MTTEYTETEKFTSVQVKPSLSKRRRVFCKAFGIPGFICAIVAMWFAVAESLVAITASGVAEIIAQKVLHMSITEILNIPVLTLCFCTLCWALLSAVLCILSRALGAKNKINHAGLVLSVVSAFGSTSLAFFSIVYMIFA